MPDRSTIQILKDMSPAVLRKLVKQLNIDSAFSDECGFLIQSTALQKWDAQCTSFLVSNGYTGGKLELTAKYIKNNGNVYVMYDSTVLDDSTAKDFI